MDVPSYLLGKQAGGGGGQPSLQNKSVTITENGTQNVTADAGYDGLENVGITTNVQPNLETKSVTITENTTTTITPTTGKDGLSSVEVTTNVSGGGDLDEYINTTISENTAYNNTFTNSFIIKPLEISINSNVTSLASAFDRFPAEIIFKNVDTSNVTTMQSIFSNSSKIKNIDLSKFDFSNVTNITYMFQNCSNLKTINFGNATFSNFTGIFERVFSGCSLLEEVDTSKFNSTTQAPRYMFFDCNKLKRIDLSSLNISGGFMWGNFENCTSLEFLDIRKFDLTSFSQFNASNFTGVPANCEIIVGTENDKNAILNLRSDFTNIKTAAEYEAQ